MTSFSLNAVHARRVLALLVLLCYTVLGARAEPLTPAARAQVAAGGSMRVIVELDAGEIDRNADRARSTRGLRRDDNAVRQARAAGYATLAAQVESEAAGPDAIALERYSHLPLAVWRLSSPAALSRLEANGRVRAVHEDKLLHTVSVSDLGFINQPQTAAQGGSGSGTVIAVIDGGLGTNYLNYADFGPCTSVGVPATCRVVYNRDYYPGKSTVVSHGTNVSAIALGVAAQAGMAMYNPFNGGGAYTSDILDAMNHIVANVNPVSYNVVALNLSLGDSSSHSTTCPTSVFAAAVTNLANVGVVTAAAAGNSGDKTGLADPACVPGVVSVGAVYDALYGGVAWGAPSSCTDTTAPDLVTCFSQSASYLTLLAPGSFVSAPGAAFEMSGTSQATAHVSGAVAVLRARYSSEPLAQIVQRLQDTGVPVVDSRAGGRTTPRLDLLGAYLEATRLTLTGSGPNEAVAGTSATYTLDVANAGPLAGTSVRVTWPMPSQASFVSASNGCVYAAGSVTCTVTSLPVGAHATFNITVQWNASGPVYVLATLGADQINAAASEEQHVAFGSPPLPPGITDTTDVPLPLWSYALLASALIAAIARQRAPGAAPLRCEDRVRGGRFPANRARRA